MSFTIKYFKYTDPITGKLTKSYGFSHVRDVHDIEVKSVNNVATIIKDDVTTKEHKIGPRVLEAIEITKEEFDALDTSEESLTSKLQREKSLVYVTKQQVRAEKGQSQTLAEDIKNSLQAAITAKI